MMKSGKFAPSSLTCFALLLTLFLSSSAAGQFTVLHTFNSTDGANPVGNLTLVDSTLFGTTHTAGANAGGMVFAINTDGTGYHVVHSLSAFSNSIDGYSPSAGLTHIGSTLFGTTQFGPASGPGVGTVFSLNSDGSSFRTLHTFSGTGDGSNPLAGLTVGGSTLYGTTNTSGPNGGGTVFAINSNGSGFQPLQLGVGAFPQADLALSASTLFGTTKEGGFVGDGSVFAVNTNGTGFAPILHSFRGTDGAFPKAGVTISGSNLFGTTSGAGAQGGGTVFTMKTDGAGFAVLHSFSGTVDGFPAGDLTLSGSTLYGTTQVTVFAMNTDGTGFHTLHSFFGTAGSDGTDLRGGLTLVGSTLFGTAYSGGSGGAGTLFAIDVPEPSSLVLAGLALATLFAYAWRHKWKVGSIQHSSVG